MKIEIHNGGIKMFIVKIFEYILLALVVMFAAIFSIIGIAMAITKNAINNMMNFKGDKKDE